MLIPSVVIIYSKYFSSFNLLLQQFVPGCCDNMFMVFQLLFFAISVSAASALMF
jgi:hypothetical protein